MLGFVSLFSGVVELPLLGYFAGGCLAVMVFFKKRMQPEQVRAITRRAGDAV